MRPIPNSALALSMIALLGALVASLATLLWDGAFPDPPGTTVPNTILAEARGWSAVTLFLALPLGFAALVTARRSLRGRLWWTGTLAYLLYTYLEMACAPPFTALYLVYIATFATALAALPMAAASFEIPALPAAFGERAPRRALATFGVVVSLGLSAAWMRDISARLISGNAAWPDPYGAVRHVVEALDLGLQVPLGLGAAALLLSRRPAGFLVGSVEVVMAVCMSAALSGMVAMSGVASGQGPAVAAPFLALFVVAALIGWRWFRAI